MRLSVSEHRREKGVSWLLSFDLNLKKKVSLQCIRGSALKMGEKIKSTLYITEISHSAASIITVSFASVNGLFHEQALCAH